MKCCGIEITCDADYDRLPAPPEFRAFIRKVHAAERGVVRHWNPSPEAREICKPQVSGGFTPVRSIDLDGDTSVRQEPQFLRHAMPAADVERERLKLRVALLQRL
jgi:hypothetical protein